MPDKERFYYAPWEKAYQRIATPFEEFIHRQTTTGILLMVCAVVALIIANSPYVDAYNQLLHSKMAISVGSWKIEHSLHHWINDGLMTIFFFVVGLEIKREVLVGELSSINNALLPVIGAVGGMVVPALLYLWVTGDTENAKGWGIPMATDIAFAVGVMALLGSRVPKSLLTFLVAVAIVDDLGAVTVIALFYTDTISTSYLGAALIILVAMIAINLMGIRRPLPYFIFTMMLWIAMEGSGIHATIAGILAAWTVPAYSRYLPRDFSKQLRKLTDKFDGYEQNDKPLINNPLQSTVTWRLSETISLAMSPLQKLETMLHIPSTYLVIPVFALANAAIPLSVEAIGNMFESTIALGIGVGLVFGKLIGIAGSVILAEMMGIGQFPKGVQRSHIIGAALLAGIGFTMSIFISELAFIWDGRLVEEAKMGILAASLVSGLAGYAWLRWVAPSGEELN